ncbi:MAG: hypothetical protein AB7O49_13885 [Sphingomonadales bacterium]
MTVLQTQQTTYEHQDEWASRFFQALLDQRLTADEFERAVRGCWESGAFILRAPQTAAWLLELAISADGTDAGYAHDAPNLGFRSQWLIGVHGQPGAIHIQAPREHSPLAEFPDLNRPPHRHDSGRIAVVTRGRAVFHAVRELPGGRTVVLDCPVETGDVILWPAWTPHTFNAKQGFWLVSAMASYVSPDEDGFVFPLEEALDGVPRSAYPPRTR